MRKFSLRTVLVSTFLLLRLLAHAEPFNLYKSLNNASEYENRLTQLVELVQRGSSESILLNFDHNKNNLFEFEVKKFLGRGHSSVILEVSLLKHLKDGVEDLSPKQTTYAMRLPAKIGPFNAHIFGDNFSYHEVLESFITGAKKLKEKGVTAVTVFEELSDKEQFALIEKIETNLTLDQWLKDLEIFDMSSSGKLSFAPGVTQKEGELSKNTKLMNDFFTFVKSAAKFEKIGDFGSSQIAYDRKKEKWILLDWLDFHQALNVSLLNITQAQEVPYIPDPFFEISFEKHSKFFHKKINEILIAKRYQIIFGKKGAPLEFKIFRYLKRLCRISK